MAGEYTRKVNPIDPNLVSFDCIMKMVFGLLGAITLCPGL
jgi:hypothetical protein